MIDFEVRECLISGWPPGELGVALTRYGALIRLGLDSQTRRRAIAWAYERWLSRYPSGDLKSGTLALNSSASDIEDHSCANAGGKLDP